MISSRGLVVFTAAALGSGLAWSPLALARPPSPGAASPGAISSTPASERSDATPAAMPVRTRSIEARIVRLHRELKITPAEEGEWKRLARDMREDAHEMRTLIQARREAARSMRMSAVQNLENYQKIVEAHAEGLKKILPDFERLYDSMPPAQQKVANRLFNQRLDQRLRSTVAPSPPRRRG